LQARKHNMSYSLQRTSPANNIGLTSEDLLLRNKLVEGPAELLPQNLESIQRAIDSAKAHAAEETYENILRKNQLKKIVKDSADLLALKKKQYKFVISKDGLVPLNTPSQNAEPYQISRTLTGNFAESLDIGPDKKSFDSGESALAREYAEKRTEFQKRFAQQFMESTAEQPVINDPITPAAAD